MVSFAQKTELKMIHIEPTNLCNLDCIMCPSRQMKRKQGYMSFELYKKLILQIKHMETFVGLFWIGESLLHPNIVEMVAMAYKHKVSTSFATNGMLLSKEMSRLLLRAGICGLAISHDGGRDYQKIRKGGDHETVFQNIKDLAKVKKEDGYTIPCQITSLKLPKYSAERLQKDYASMMEHIPAISFIPLGVHRKGKYLRRGKIMKTPKYAEGYHDCRDGRTRMLIGWDGRVTFCCGDYDLKTVMGNANTEPLEEIWDKIQNDIHPRLDRGEFEEIPACKDCVWCRGDKMVDYAE